jgi:anti-sigma regulatory factor (Ser/Thr protein kinase)
MGGTRSGAHACAVEPDRAIATAARTTAAHAAGAWRARAAARRYRQAGEALMISGRAELHTQRQRAGARIGLGPKTCRGEAENTVAAGSAGFRWLMLAAEMAGLVNGGWRPSLQPGVAGLACLPRIATRTMSADAGSARAARDFTVATLRRWGIADRGHDITVVVSELLTNALRHALPGPGDAWPRWQIRLGLLQHGSCVLCAVADRGSGIPVPQTPGSLAETGRGLQMICALSDRWGYSTPNEAGKVVWAVFGPPPG